MAELIQAEVTDQEWHEEKICEWHSKYSESGNFEAYYDLTKLKGITINVREYVILTAVTIGGLFIHF